MSSWGNTLDAGSQTGQFAPPMVRGASAAPVAAAFDLQRYLLLVGLHVLLGLMCKQSSAISTIYAWGTLLVGVNWARTQRQPEKIAAFAAYIMGAEVLWRMTKAFAFWEFGKYAVVLILLLGCQRWRPVRPTLVSTWYFLLLLPSCIFTWTASDFTFARKQTSFNLSGPLSLAVCAAFCSRLRLDAAALHRIARAAILPIFSVSTVVVFGIATAKELTFGTESNPLMAGGFGANQVTAVFSVGIILTALTALLLSDARKHLQRTFWLVAAVLFSAQSALTFSRSGLYMSGLSVLAAVISTAKSARLRNAYVLTGIVLYVVGTFVVFPLLNSFTGGALEARFSDTNVTGRDMLMKSDLDVFQRHPFLGVGPGMAIANRGITFQAIAAHSEITRTLAEHGILGLGALIILCTGIWRRIASMRDVKMRGLFIATASFGLLCMLSNAMRIVAPAFMIGLIFAAERPVERTAHRR